MTKTFKCAKTEHGIQDIRKVLTLLRYRTKNPKKGSPWYLPIP